jgi:hypothetical protein
MGFNISWRNGKIVRPTRGAHCQRASRSQGRPPRADQERWARLERVPRRWRPGDEDDPGVPVGLLLNLERCTRGDPSWQMAMAIRTAFELGRASIAGKASKAAYVKLIDDTNALTARRSKAAKTTAAKKTWWHVHAKPIWLREHELFPDPAAASAAAIIARSFYSWG